MMIRFHFLLASLLMTVVTYGQLKKDLPSAGSHNELPAMTVTRLNGTQFSAKSLTGKVIIVMFQPDCDHCQREANQIHDNLAFFKDYQLHFIAAAAITDIQRFAVDYKLNNLPNVHFGLTTVNDVIDTYGPIDAPSLYIYSKDKKLVKKFNGETDISIILKSL